MQIYHWNKPTILLLVPSIIHFVQFLTSVPQSWPGRWYKANARNIRSLWAAVDSRKFWPVVISSVIYLNAHGEYIIMYLLMVKRLYMTLTTSSNNWMWSEINFTRMSKLCTNYIDMEISGGIYYINDIWAFQGWHESWALQHTITQTECLDSRYQSNLFYLSSSLS